MTDPLDEALGRSFLFEMILPNCCQNVCSPREIEPDEGGVYTFVVLDGSPPTIVLGFVKSQSVLMALAADIDAERQKRMVAEVLNGDLRSLEPIIPRVLCGGTCRVHDRRLICVFSVDNHPEITLPVEMELPVREVITSHLRSRGVDIAA